MCTLVLYAASCGEPGRRPVLPPVVVPLNALVERALAAIEEAHPRAPRLLVRAAQVAEVVHLEPGRAALVRRLEHQMLAADFVELESPRRRRRATVRLESSGRPASGRWIVVHRVGLRARGSLRLTPVDTALVERARDLVHVREEAMAEIHRRRRTRSTRGTATSTRPCLRFTAVIIRRTTVAAVRKSCCSASDRVVRRRLVRRVARASTSRCVVASSTPSVSPLGNRPISFAAPRIVVGCCGTVSPYVPASCGVRPMRRL